jgi:hypothetical protein
VHRDGCIGIPCHHTSHKGLSLGLLLQRLPPPQLVVAGALLLITLSITTWHTAAVGRALLPVLLAGPLLADHTT